MARFGWQSVFSVVACFSVVLFVVMLYLLPETLKSRFLLKGSLRCCQHTDCCCSPLLSGATPFVLLSSLSFFSALLLQRQR